MYTVQTPGLYDIIIDHSLDIFGTDLGPQDYGIAWWAGADTVITNPLAGDFDNDNDVDGADFLAWQRNPGVGSLGDWQGQFGSGTATLVPEPGAWMLALVGGLGFAGPLGRRGVFG